MSPRKKEDNQLIKDQRRKEILEVSLRLFANRGYESTSIAQISREAGISKGLIYNYFKSKEELLKSLVFDLNSMESTFLEDIQDDDPGKMLQNIFTSYFKMLTQNKDKLRLITALTFQIEKFEFIQDLASQKMNAYLSLFEDLLTKLNFKDPKNEAILLGVLFDGIATQYLVIHNDYPLNEIKEYLFNKYCKN